MQLTIWFFIGVLLTIYGILIAGLGIYHLGTPPQGIVLGELHADLWWGILMTALGVLYVVKNRPGRS